MTSQFDTLVQLARNDKRAFLKVPRLECVEAARAHITAKREAIRERHQNGESGVNVVHALSEAADGLLRGVLDFALANVGNRDTVLSRIALCAPGGYGRCELSPFSDLDVCLLYDKNLDDNIRALNSYLLPFLWDIGYKVGYAIRSISETVELITTDHNAFTAMLESRLIAGDTTTFARLKLRLHELLAKPEMSQEYIQTKVRERYELLPDAHKDLFQPEPNVKETCGGLRDYHTALWLLMVTYSATTIDEVVSLGVITPDEHLQFVQSLDFLWRIRNELHFHSQKDDDILSFANQKHIAQAFGYGTGNQEDIYRLMEDYYAAAQMVHRLLRIATQVCYQKLYATENDDSRLPARAQIVVRDGQLYAGVDDPNWFAEQPSRLMEVFWECARHNAPLSRDTERSVISNLHLVNDAFRQSDPVRRLFTAICNRPLHAGFALRQAANVGLLGRYLPEFAEIQGTICYEDFHHFPVDEHTLRAIEALAALPTMEGAVAACLHKALEHLPDAYILVIAILFHDLGKVHGETHVQEGVEISNQICHRIGMAEEDAERIAFLVRHHLLMTRLSQHRDIDDSDIVQSFAETMKTEERLRTLFLLSYADLAAVGPAVWNDWKGALLTKLYLRTEKILLGRAEIVDEAFWNSPKADEVRALVPDSLTEEVEGHLKGLGDRYFLAFSPKHIAAHIACVDQARVSKLNVTCSVHEQTQMSEVVVSTMDRHGLFAKIAGSFASQLIDVNSAALFTRPDGYVVDCFTVFDAARGRPLTDAQFRGVERVLKAVLLDDRDIQEFVDQSRRRLFALLQPRIPVYTRVTFDNESSRTHTVIDIETGDRTGLLYDITRAEADAGLDIATARIVTDARRVRDSFYVTLNGHKIEDPQLQSDIRDTLHNAIHPRTLAETKGGTV